MTQAYYEQWGDFAKKMQEPFQAIAELNVKTLQGFTYIKPEELTNVKKPEEVVERQIALAIENGHKALNYMQEAYKILEKTLVGIVQEGKKRTNEKAH